jgi:hypothetical protein
MAWRPGHRGRGNTGRRTEAEESTGFRTATCCLPVCQRRGYTHTIGMPTASKMPPSRPCSAMPIISLRSSQGSEAPATDRLYLWHLVSEGLFWPRYLMLRQYSKVWLTRLGDLSSGPGREPVPPYSTFNCGCRLPRNSVLRERRGCAGPVAGHCQRNYR